MVDRKNAEVVVSSRGSFQEILFKCFTNNLFLARDCQGEEDPKRSLSDWIVIKCDYSHVPSFEIPKPQPQNICDPEVGPAVYVQYANWHSVRYGQISEVRIFGQNSTHTSEPFYTIGCYQDEFAEIGLNTEHGDGHTFARHLFNFLNVA